MLKAMIIGTTVYLMATLLLMQWAPIINQSLVQVGYSLALPSRATAFGLLLVKVTLLSGLTMLMGDLVVTKVRSVVFKR